MEEITELFIRDTVSFIRALVGCFDQAEVDEKTAHNEDFRYWLFRYAKDIQEHDPKAASYLIAQFCPETAFVVQDM